MFYVCVGAFARWWGTGRAAHTPAPGPHLGVPARVLPVQLVDELLRSLDGLLGPAHLRLQLGRLGGAGLEPAEQGEEPCRVDSEEGLS